MYIVVEFVGFSSSGDPVFSVLPPARACCGAQCNPSIKPDMAEDKMHGLNAEVVLILKH